MQYSVLTSAGVYMRECDHLVLFLLQRFLQINLCDRSSNVSLDLLDLGPIGLQAFIPNWLFTQGRFPLIMLTNQRSCPQNSLSEAQAHLRRLRLDYWPPMHRRPLAAEIDRLDFQTVKSCWADVPCPNRVSRCQRRGSAARLSYRAQS